MQNFEVQSHFYSYRTALHYCLIVFDEVFTTSQLKQEHALGTHSSGMLRSVTV
jgi:hypothetical protein